MRPSSSALIESSSRTLHQRAATIAATPVLRSAIATDAATLEDLIANEHVLVPQPGERLALYQGDSELLRVPAQRAALGTGLVGRGDGLELAATCDRSRWRTARSRWPLRSIST